MKYCLAAIILLLLAALPGCRFLYEGVKTARIEDCYRLPYPDQEECLRQANVAYDIYEQERQEARRRQ